MLEEARRTLAASISPELERIFASAGAAIRVRGGDKSAIEALPQPTDAFDFRSRFALGLANLAEGSSEVAAARFKEVMDNPRPNTSLNAAMSPLFYARALVKLGKTDETRKAYERFFDNFTSADADLPILGAAKAEYARLNS
jgi:hypothetical protein